MGAENLSCVKSIETHARTFLPLNISAISSVVSSILALEATEPVSEPVTQMAVELINNHLISVQQKR